MAGGIEQNFYFGSDALPSSSDQTMKGSGYPTTFTPPRLNLLVSLDTANVTPSTGGSGLFSVQFKKKLFQVEKIVLAPLERSCEKHAPDMKIWPTGVELDPRDAARPGGLRDATPYSSISVDGVEYVAVAGKVELPLSKEFEQSPRIIEIAGRSYYRKDLLEKCVVEKPKTDPGKPGTGPSGPAGGDSPKS